jgi:branched-chain amino acid transport system ATP-binding protein
MVDLDMVTVRFGPICALDGISLRLPSAGLVAIIGPNGSGKSTLFDVISGFVDVNSGRVALDGLDVKDFSVEQIARCGVRRLFQRPRYLPCRNAIENVMLGCRSPRGESLLGSMIGFGTTAEEYFNEGRSAILLGGFGRGLREISELRIASYGQRKLVSLAAATIGSPKLLMLDEPFAGLDEDMRRSAGKVIEEEVERGCLVLIIEHDFRGFEHLVCNSVGLVDGQVASVGDLATTLQVIRRLGESM